jgi:hypothetical protein
MRQPSGGTPALRQADERLACLPVCDRVPAPAEFVDDALRPDRPMDVHVRQAMVRVFEPDAADAGNGPGYRGTGDRVLARRPGDEPGEKKPHPQTICPDVEAAQRPPCDLPADVRLDSERSPRRGGWRILSASVPESRAKRPLRAPGTGIASHKAKSRREGRVPRLADPRRMRARVPGRGELSGAGPACRLITIGMS